MDGVVKIGRLQTMGLKGRHNELYIYLSFLVPKFNSLLLSQRMPQKSCQLRRLCNPITSEILPCSTVCFTGFPQFCYIYPETKTTEVVQFSALKALSLLFQYKENKLGKFKETHCILLHENTLSQRTYLGI